MPDGVSIRQRVAARMHAESDQVFDLLAVVGRDCVGALQFVWPEDKKPTLHEAKGQSIGDSEIAAKLKNLRSKQLANSEEEDFRLSIAGAQEKTAFLNINGKWHIPINATPTTHIFKPQLGEVKLGLSFADSVENEWLCAKIVQAFGIPVTEREIQTFEDLKVLIVERFDRVWHDKIIIRIPQEDICQAFSIPNFEKYENDGGPGIVQIMGILNESTDREQDRYNFMKTQVIFLLLAALDGHAKNFSMRWAPPGFNMTPLYDILSAQPLLDKGSFQIEKLKMAMSYGENRHYKLKQICHRHLMQTAKICRFEMKQMNDIIDETISQIPMAISKAEKLLNRDFPEEIAKSIFTGMKKRISQFSKVAD